MIVLDEFQIKGRKKLHALFIDLGNITNIVSSPKKM
jgi:hypothetical protein